MSELRTQRRLTMRSAFAADHSQLWQLALKVPNSSLPAASWTLSGRWVPGSTTQQRLPTCNHLPCPPWSEVAKEDATAKVEAANMRATKMEAVKAEAATAEAIVETAKMNVSWLCTPNVHRIVLQPPFSATWTQVLILLWIVVASGYRHCWAELVLWCGI